MKILMMGDIHGQFEYLEAGLEYAQKNDLKFLQIGDLTDSFSRTIKDQKKCLDLAIEASQDENNIFLLGNHDLSYLFPEYYRCSGFSRNKWGQFIKKYHKITFKNYYTFDNVLVTHAGFSKRHLKILEIYENLKVNDHDIESVRGYLDKGLENADNIYKAGYASGGGIPVGGIFWCRPWKFKPIGDIVQIFGHTKVDNIDIHPTDKYYNIDTLEFGDKSLLKYENGIYKIVGVDEYI